MEHETRGKNTKYREYYKDPMTGKHKRASVTLEGPHSRKNEKLASEILSAKIEAILSQSSDNDTVLFSTLIEKYLEKHKDEVRNETYIRDKCHCDIFLNMIGRDTLVCKLSARYIRDCLDATKKPNVTKNEYLKHLKSVLRWGYRNDYVDDISYLEKLTRYEDKRPKESIEDKYLEKSEMELLLSHIRKSRMTVYIDLTEFLLLSGLRIGEAIALLKTDISSESIHIDKSFKLTTGNVSEPKTPESYRDVFIQNELDALIKRIKKHNCVNHVSSIIFFSINGSYIDYDNYRMWLRRNSIKAIGRPIRPHALRHTHASMLLAKGVSIDSISRRLGHADSKITRAIYLHILEELKQKDNEQIKNIRLI